jgi:spectinomycin phosphotransferase
MRNERVRNGKSHGRRLARRVPPVRRVAFHEGRELFLRLKHQPWDTDFTVLTRPAGLDEMDVGAALARSWALEVGHLEYIPKGFGSYHWQAATSAHRYFLTVDDLDSKPWLGGSRDTAFDALQAAYDATLALHEKGNLSFVVAPTPRLDGGTALRLSERYALTVFPFVSGESGLWGEAIGSSDRQRLLRQLGELHRSTPAVAFRAPRHSLVLPGRTGLESALDDLARPWTTGPLSEQARQTLAVNAQTAHGWLASFDHLAGLVAGTGGLSVVTHGEPHPGNLIRSHGGLLLVDWDTMGLAQPERDLWMLDDGTPDGWAPYTEVSGRAVDDTAIALFRLAWILSDIAAYAALFRSDHGSDEDTETSLRNLADAFAGATSTRPYGA